MTQNDTKKEKKTFRHFQFISIYNSNCKIKEFPEQRLSLATHTHSSHKNVQKRARTEKVQEIETTKKQKKK